MPSAALVAAGSPGAHIKVAGEVRTIDPSLWSPARLWGRGRVASEVHGRALLIGGPCTNGAIKYGLSTVAVDWGSAAEACPVGTWVCRPQEIVACNTSRPDSFLDGISCSGMNIDYESHLHSGWLAAPGQAPSGQVSGRAFDEIGFTSNPNTCQSLPVWCCWE